MAIRLFHPSSIGRLCKATHPKPKILFHTSSIYRQQQQQQDEAKYYLPHESAPHAATILGFPSRQSVSKALHPGTCREIIDLAATIAEFEPVRLYTRPEDIVFAQELIKQRIHHHQQNSSYSHDTHNHDHDQAKEKAKPISDLQSQIHILPCPTNHCWVRDTGPVFVRLANTDTNINTNTDGNQSGHFAIDFSFCEWGNKHTNAEYYPEFKPSSHDDDLHAWPIPSSTTLAENASFAARVIASFSSSSPLPSPSTTTTTPPPPVTNPPTHLLPTTTTTTTTTTTPLLRLEGGAIEVDGQGTFLATKSSIFCTARNPALDRATAERELRRLLGVRKFIWFPGRRGLDVTDAHVDALVRVVRPGVVVVSRPFGYRDLNNTGNGTVDDNGGTGAGASDDAQTRRHEWMHVYDEIQNILARETDATGRRFEVHEIEEPDPRYLIPTSTPTLTSDQAHDQAEDPAASYVNFYFVNGAVVVPAFGDPVADERAVRTMRRLVPERAVRTVRVNCLPRMGGVLHCVTQQVPAF